MKTAVIYYSKLGHSKKIADAISQELNVSSQDVRKNPQLDDLDELYIVSGIYGGKSAPVLLEYLKTLDHQHVKVAHLLTSSAGKTTRASEVRAVLTDRGIPVGKEEFTCQGAILFVGIGHPNKADIENAIRFVRSTSQQ